MFDIVIERVFKNEGAFQNDSRDRGNWTSGIIGVGKLNGSKYGISAMSYPTVDIVNLTLAGAKEIYRKDWWDAMQMESFRPAMQYQMFDAAINHGMYQATKMLQRAAGSKDDGVIGSMTIGKVSKMDLNDMLMLFLAERLIFMTNIKIWGSFSKGWARRIAHNLQIASIDN